MKRIASVCALLAVVFIVGCQKPEQAEVKSWAKYVDQYYPVTFTYPEGWMVAPDGNKMNIYVSSDARDKFFGAQNKPQEGVEYVINYKRLPKLMTVDEVVDSVKKDLVDAGFAVEPVKEMTLGGVKALQLVYSGALPAVSGEGAVNATFQMTFAVKDTIAYETGIKAYGKTFDGYKFIADTLVGSITLPKPREVKKGEDLEAPSANMVPFDNQFFTIMQPDNFTQKFPEKKKDQIFVVKFQGYRNDCDLTIDQIPAKNLTTEKAFEQNAGKFPGAGSKGEATIDGVTAKFINYTPVKGISSRAYFFVKNDKVTRVIFNYSTPLKEKFVMTFEKMIGSLKLK